LEYAADVLKIRDVSDLGSACNLVEPAHCDWFQAGIIRLFVRIDDIDFDLDGKLPTLHPAFSLFTSFRHINLEN
jgi:hypothetical protein